MGSAVDDQVNSLVSALVETNDQIVALYDLLAVGFSSLDEATSLQRILESGAKLLGANLALWTAESPDDGIPSFGPRPDYYGSNGATLHGDTIDPSNSSMQTQRVDVQGPNSRLWCRLEASRATRPFSTGEGKTLTAVANIALLAEYVTSMHRTEVATAIVKHDHETAGQLAALALPDDRPAFDGVRVKATSKPARMAGGDLYYFDQIDDTFWFMVGDVSGKGMPSAVVMLSTISAAKAAFRANPDHVSDALSEIEALIFDYLEATNRFVTAVVGRYDTTSGELQLLNAGHSPVVTWIGDEAVSLRPTNPPLGVFQLTVASPRIEEFRAAPDLALIVGSDGLTEQADSTSDMYGMDRFVATVEQACRSADEADPKQTVDDIHAEIHASVDDFAGAAVQSDDQTLFVAAFNHDDGTNGADRRIDDARRSELTIPADPEATPEIGTWLASLELPNRKDTDVDEAVKMGLIALAVHEVAMNSIRHATGGDGLLHLDAGWDDHELTITVRDRGERVFDEDDAPEPVPGQPQVGGYGLMIVRQVAGTLHYDRVDDENHWTMTFALAS